jgi:hypothetical protein
MPLRDRNEESKVQMEYIMKGVFNPEVLLGGRLFTKEML